MKKIRFIQIKIKALLVYILCVFLLYLAGSYLGGFMLFFFYVSMAFPIISLILLIISFRTLKYHQDFSTEHPFKGEDIKYSLMLSNESILPVHDLQIKFISVNPMLVDILKDFSVYLKGNSQQKQEYSINCAYRGIYRAGLKEIRLTDLARFISICLPVWHRTFYVYPRILKLENFKLGSEKKIGTGKKSSRTGLPDYTLFKNIHKYKTGESVRYLYWKKYGATGIPFIKEFDSLADEGISIYLDLNKVKQKSIKTLEIEDVSIEILVALVKYVLDANIPLSVFAPGRDTYHFQGSHSDHFKDFYDSTINLLFQETPSPAQLYRANMQAGYYKSESVIFITHLMDTKIFNLAEESLKTGASITIIFNHVGLDSREKRSALQYFNYLRDKGCQIIDVHSSESIIQDLESAIYAKIV